MVETGQNQYLPDEVSPPGETLLETLEALDMTQAELAKRTGRPKKTINEIVKGKAGITPETALQFERVIGVPASFWNHRERHYREAIARQQERAHLRQHLDWLREVPVRALNDLGWVPKHRDKVEQLRAVLSFFGVASPDEWTTLWLTDRSVAFRKSAAFESDPGAVATWLRKGEIEARGISSAPYEKARFEQTLGTLRRLTLAPSERFQPDLVAACASCGVAVVFVPELSRSRVSGATRWLTPTKALIQLSLRYRTDDHLWFTFFHEAGHILLHGKRAVFLEEEVGTHDEREEQANRFAADLLIPPKKLRLFLEAQPSGRKHRISKEAVRGFAAEIGVAPGIVVGRLQHDGVLPYTHLNALKRRFQWRTDVQP